MPSQSASASHDRPGPRSAPRPRGPCSLHLSDRVATWSRLPYEVKVIGKKPGQSVEKRRREREKHLKRQDKAARRRDYKEEKERRKEAGEEEVIINPLDVHLDTDIPIEEPGNLVDD
ncbi:hypothetical protein [Engelhardtia mirabilis]|uniref:Uncharacterized protein n=1 Tax=Engelhardtia mirabilis TaxID=2528011 RepID=A0A518BMC0_9BACT|nr:hypothetical protein Pla133_32190 [Planctomycetes bacterium Pla133]QDV02451.1 hypothetical protein Pla86_32180 [Planctomycetes bacterium Pla86]